MQADDITRLLNQAPEALSREQREEMERVYQRLKQVARIQRVKIRNGALNTTALVNEAWIKSQQGGREFADRDHFYAYCAGPP